ncbi:hypothetical protein MRX96_043869 [Rhipicephalus microplus]
MRASIDHPANEAPLKQNTTDLDAAPNSHKGRATSSAVSDGPATNAGINVQDFADVPQVERATSVAYVPPDSKPFDATIGEPMTASKNGPLVGILVPAVIQQLATPGSSHGVKAADSAHSKDHLPAGPSTTSNQEGNKVANRDRGKGKAAPQQGQPPAGLPGAHPPVSGQTARVIVKKQIQGKTKKRKADNTASHTGLEGETFSPSPAVARKMNGGGSSGHWFFYGGPQQRSFMIPV